MCIWSRTENAIGSRICGPSGTLASRRPTWRPLSDAQLQSLPLGDALPPTAPAPPLDVGDYVETEYGVFRVHEAGLQKVNMARLAIDEPNFSDKDAQEIRERVVFLPAALVRALPRVNADGQE